MYYSHSEHYGNINGGTGPKIVTVGGGTGLSTILRGIKTITENVTAVVTVADDGGGSGKLRRELNMLPPGDIRNCISALSDNEGAMDELLKYRFSEGSLKGQSMGNLIIAGLYEIYGNFETAVEKIHDILKIKGRVVPVTSASVNLCAELENGTIVKGESQIPETAIEEKSGIKRVYLEPENVKATDMAITALLTADVIVLGPGSLYSSIIPNLLVDGISEAISRSSAIKMYICNVMTQPGETDGYSVVDCLNAVETYLGKNVIQFLVANNRALSADVLLNYTAEGTRQILMEHKEREEISDRGIAIIENNFVRVGPDGLVRHDSDRIANVLFGLVG